MLPNDFPSTSPTAAHRGRSTTAGMGWLLSTTGVHWKLLEKLLCNRRGCPPATGRVHQHRWMLHHGHTPNEWFFLSRKPSFKEWISGGYGYRYQYIPAMTVDDLKISIPMHGHGGTSLCPPKPYHVLAFLQTSVPMSNCEETHPVSQ